MNECRHFHRVVQSTAPRRAEQSTQLRNRHISRREEFFGFTYATTETVERPQETSMVLTDKEGNEAVYAIDHGSNVAVMGMSALSDAEKKHIQPDRNNITIHINNRALPSQGHVWVQRFKGSEKVEFFAHIYDDEGLNTYRVLNFTPLSRE